MTNYGMRFGDNASFSGVNFGGSHNTAGVSAPSTQPTPSGLTTRLGFAVDVIGYTSRPPADRGHLQHRLTDVVADVLRDLGLEGESDPGAGDDKLVLLPVDANPTTALPRLLATMTDRLATDNARYTDPVRLRMAVASGLAGRGSNGFTGELPSLLGRLLDAPSLRTAAAAKPRVNLVALVSDDLYRAVVGGGYAQGLADRLAQVDVTVKNFRAYAWLWPRE